MFPARSIFVAPLGLPLAVLFAAAFVAASTLAATSAAASPRSTANSASIKSPKADRKEPLVVVVSLNRQRLTVYNRDGVVAGSPISSGSSKFPTITGVFSIIGKSVDHVSNIYEGAEMPYMQRLTWTGTALHAGHLPGYPASHGCIRLPYGFSQRLYDMTAMNTRVIVINGDVVPKPISHAKLMAPLAPDYADQPVAAAAVGSRVASLTGIGTAYAAPRGYANGEVPLTAAAKARFAETQVLSDAIRPLDTANAAALARVKTASKTLNLARLELIRFNEALENGAEAIARINRNRAVFERQLEMIGRKAEAATRPRTIEALAKAEDAAEARLFDLAQQLENAHQVIEGSADVRPQIEARIAAAEDDLRDATNAHAVSFQALKDARASFNLKRAEDARYMKPVSVFVSRKDQRLYVRQGFEPLLEVPVTIDAPELPLGTHVYTAMGYRDGGAALDWTAVSLTSRQSAQRIATSPSSALDRVHFPAEALAAINERVKPGSSLIISDETTSRYFGDGTDFTIDAR